MAIFKCKMCGGTLEINQNESVATCEYCGSQQTIPKLDDERRANLYDRANHFRRNNEYDKAERIYEQILNEDPTDAEAYWSLVLCRYGIEYVEDPATHKRVPTVNRAQYTSIFDDDNYKSAIEHADTYQRTVYENEAKAINEIQKGILVISQKEEPFDVFICYKETDNSGRRTRDSVLANDLYHQLMQEGFKVFYSRITLEDKLGTAYEPYIFAALNSAKVMVVLGTKPEYFSAVWVKNEWSRYLALVNKSGGKKVLIPAYRDMDPYDLPEEFSHLQAQDMSKLGFMQDLIRGIKKIISKNEINTSSDKTSAQQESGKATRNALLDRGTMALEDHEWDKANEYFDQVLNTDARCGEAYLGRVLADNKASDIDSFVSIRLNRYSNVRTTQHNACDEDDATIDDIANQYTIPNYLDWSTIKSWFNYDLSYESELESRQKDYNTEDKYLQSDNLVNRTKKFLDGDKKDSFLSAIERILSELRNRINAAKEKDEAKEREIQKAYAEFVQEQVAYSKSRYEFFSEKREKEYSTAVKAQESATTESDYNKLSERFSSIGDYKDAKERAKDCKFEAGSIALDVAKKAAKTKRKKTAIIVTIIAACIIGVIVMISISGSNKLKYVHQEMIGQTFTGKYEYYDYSSLGSYRDTREYTLKIIDDTHCSVSYEGRDNDYEPYSGADDNATYTITGGLSGISFNWESEKVWYSVEPFSVEIVGDKITLTTSNFNSGKGLTLKN